MNSELGQHASREEVDEVFSKASLDGKVITFDDFMSFMKKDYYKDRFA